MNKRVLMPLAIVVLLAVGGAAAISIAEDRAGTSPSSAGEQTVVTEASGHAGEFMGRGHHWPSLEAIRKKLGITDEQKKQMRALSVGFRDRTRKARMELMSLRDEKQTMLLSGKIDQQKLAQIDDQVVKLVSDVMREKLKLRRDRLALLNQEQIGRIADWQADKAFRSKMMKRMRWGRMHDRERHDGF
jgi:Spy/CpxP family protein refolding chaperone